VLAAGLNNSALVPPKREACARRDGAPPHHIGAQHVEHRIADPRGKRRGGGDQGEWRALTPG